MKGETEGDLEEEQVVITATKRRIIRGAPLDTLRMVPTEATQRRIIRGAPLDMLRMVP